MKRFKSSKIFLFLTAVVMFACAMVSQLSIFYVHANISPMTYFNFSNKENAVFDYVDNLDQNYKVNNKDVNDGVAFSVKENDTISLKNKVVVDDLGVKIIADSNIEKFTVELKASSYDVNGNIKENSNGEYEFVKEISTKYQVQTSGAVNSDGEIVLHFGVEDSFITVGVNGGEKFPIADTNNPFYKVRHVDKTAVEFSISIDQIKDNKTVDFVVTDINQKASNGYNYATNKFNQNFKLNSKKDSVLNFALPMVALEDNFFTNTDGDNYTIRKLDGALYTVNINAYSIAKNYSNSNIFFKAGEFDTQFAHGITISTETSSDRIIFNLKNGITQTTDMSFYVSIREGSNVFDIQKYTAQVFSSSLEENEAPEYKTAYDNNGDILPEVETRIKSFQKALDMASKKTTSNVTHSINLGDRITIPSLENFVFDDYSSFNKLSKTIHLITPSNEDKTSSTSSIQLDEVGVYKLYVTFKDENGKDMEKEDFIPSDDNPNPKYAPYVFTITINDDAPLIIKNDKQQENGYVGVKYKALPFQILATGYNKKYTLWYSSSLNATETDSSWKQIKTISDYRLDNTSDYTEEELKAIAYDGELTFVPNEKGSYKINCYVSSEKSYRFEECSTIIRVASEPNTVKPASDWLKENVWSVVFLSVGSVCLIAIIVLLCIKPKDEKTKD